MFATVRDDLSSALEGKMGELCSTALDAPPTGAVIEETIAVLAEDAGTAGV